MPMPRKCCCRNSVLGGTRMFSVCFWQVRTLEMQRTQQEQLLDFLHQRHQEDLDLITHGYR